MEQADASPDVARLSDEEETRLAVALASLGQICVRVGNLRRAEEADAHAWTLRKAREVRGSDDRDADDLRLGHVGEERLSGSLVPERWPPTCVAAFGRLALTPGAQPSTS